MELANLLKCWHEQLYHVRREDVQLQEATVPLEFVPVTADNAALVSELRAPEYVGQFRQQLAQGDFGFYAYHEGRPVGYGWVKYPGADDFFFNIGEGCCYLCRFFVHESMRGKKIYPHLISALMEHEADCDTFYIAVETGNEASVRGLKKVGFRFVKEYSFWRGFRRTFNKQTLKRL